MKIQKLKLVLMESKEGDTYIGRTNIQLNEIVESDFNLIDTFSHMLYQAQYNTKELSYTHIALFIFTDDNTLSSAISLADYNILKQSTDNYDLAALEVMFSREVLKALGVIL